MLGLQHDRLVNLQHAAKGCIRKNVGVPLGTDYKDDLYIGLYSGATVFPLLPNDRHWEIAAHVTLVNDELAFHYTDNYEWDDIFAASLNGTLRGYQGKFNDQWSSVISYLLVIEED
jgi:hypothetical protein